MEIVESLLFMASNNNSKPKVIYFGSIPYQVCFEDLTKGKDEENQESDDNFGCADHNAQKIMVDNTSGSHVQRETLLHEILHCSMMWSGVSHRLSRIDAELEEDVIQCISPFIFNFFTDKKNAEVLKYLLTQE